MDTRDVTDHWNLDRNRSLEINILTITEHHHAFAKANVLIKSTPFENTGCAPNLVAVIEGCSWAESGSWYPSSSPKV